MSPSPHTWSEGARLRLVPAVIRQYSNVSSRFTSSRRSASTTQAWSRPAHASRSPPAWNRPRDRRRSAEGQALPVLRARSRSNGNALRGTSPPEPARHEFRRVGGQKRPLNSDTPDFAPSLARCRSRAASSRGVAPASGTPGSRICPSPSRRIHPVPDIGRLLRAAFDVNEKRRIAADADRVEMVEEEEPIAAEQILDVVLGRDHRRVHARLIEKTVKGARCRTEATGQRSPIMRLGFHSWRPLSPDLARSKAPSRL